MLTYKKRSVRTENEIDKPGGVEENPFNCNPLTPHMTPQCKHPIVKVVAREDDVEFVECQNCGEVFDSAEYNDIAIEEKAAAESTED